jgi:hypothetical protein
MKERILKLKSKKNLYEVAGDIGISEASLYCYLSNFKKVENKILNKLEKYFKGEKDENKSFRK